jgi:pyruvate kinase
VQLSSHPVKDNILGLDYELFESDVTVGDRILIDDGLAQLRVISKETDTVTAKATISCTIKKGKTVSLPDTKLSFGDAISKKDSINIQNAVELGFDFLDISFVRNIDDIRAIKQLIGSAKISLIAKVENAEGIQSIDEVLPLVDALMIPRGDLAVETPFENLPVIQKEMSLKAAQFGKPVIYASQILDSMKLNRFPSRAEISDLGNAVYDRVDAIMLAQETAIGAFPATTVQTAQKIVNRVEQSFTLDPLFSDEFILDTAASSAKNPKTLEALEKALKVTYQLANGYKFNCPYGLDAYQSMQEFWYEFEPLVYLSKLRKPLSLMFESPDVRALRQVGILYGVEGKIS